LLAHHLGQRTIRIPREALVGRRVENTLLPDDVLVDQLIEAWPWLSAEQKRRVIDATKLIPLPRPMQIK
jgi:hypothetical protein